MKRRLREAIHGGTEVGRACDCAGVGNGTVHAQNAVPLQSLSQYGSAHAQPAMAFSAAAPLPGHQQSVQADFSAHSSRQAGGPAGSKSQQGGSRAGATPLYSLPDISAEELPLRYVDRGKLEFSAERLKVRSPLLSYEVPSAASGKLGLLPALSRALHMCQGTVLQCSSPSSWHYHGHFAAEHVLQAKWKRSQSHGGAAMGCSYPRCSSM